MKALLLVDVQNDFVSGTLGSEWARKTAPRIIEYAKECRSNGFSIYATMDTHKDETYGMSLEGQKLPTKHCIVGTDGWRIVDGLVKDENGNVIVPQGHIVQKRTFGSLDMLGRFGHDFGNADTNLGGNKETLEEIKICGFCTSICVISNALILRAFYPNVKITIVENLCADISEESHVAALAVAKNCHIDIETVIQK